MRSHQKHERGTELIREYMARWYPEPSHFQDFGYLSQVLQAEGMRMAFEAHRRARPRTMGSLYWQLNDSWPVVSWSSLDSSGRWKALHFAAKRAFAPVLVSPVISGDTLNVWVVSDRLEAFDARLEVTASSFHGEELSHIEIPLRVAHSVSERVFAESVALILDGRDPAEVVVETRLTGREGTLSENHVYFRTPRELRLEDPGIQWNLGWEEWGFRIEVTADALARDVFLFLRIPPESHTSVLFSDNYFDLVPGRTKVVYLRLDPSPGDAVTVDDISAMLSVRSLADVF
jgi:beta-mannosidase